MKTLYIDTSSNYLYTGVVEDNQLLGQVKEQLDKDLSIFTLPKIKEMMDKMNIIPNDIDQIMVVDGPGSFTGIRIGMTVAKTYAWALNKKLITISSLEAMSTMAAPLEQFDYLVPIIDARRDYVYSGIYNKDGEVILENAHRKIEVLQRELDKLAKEYVIITNQEVNVKGNIIPYDPNILKIVNTYQNREGINPHQAEPNYLKRTEAEESLAA